MVWCVWIIPLPSDCSICHQMSSHQGSRMVLETQVYLLSHCWTWHLNVHVHAKKKKKKEWKKEKRKSKRACTHTSMRAHTSQRLCESQNAEPEGCCVSDVCIVYSVVPVHVGDCCPLRPHSSLALFTMTGADSRLLSRRAERPSKEKGE